MTTSRAAVKDGPQGRPTGTAAKRRPLTAPVTNTPTMVIAPSRRLGAWKTTTAPRSGAQLTLFRMATDTAGPFPGAICRYLVDVAISRHAGAGWPLGTLVVNATGPWSSG
jgi:hypothetical protein